MKKFLYLFVFFSFAASAQWFYGAKKAVNLENKIEYKNKVSSETGSLDPSVTAVNAATGSVYQSTNGNVYVKKDSGLTSNWEPVFSGTGAPDTLAGFDSSGNLYSLPTWTFDPDVNGLASVMTTDGTSHANKERFLINTVFGDGVSGDITNYHDIFINNTTNANYDISNYKVFYSNFNQANGATVTNATLLDNGYGGDLTGNFVGIANSYSGTAANITHMQLNLSGDTSSNFLGINQQYNFDSIGGTIHEMSYNGTNTGSLSGARVDVNGTNDSVSSFVSVVQGTITNQLEHVNLSSSAAIGGNAFSVNSSNSGDIAGQLNIFNGSNSGELTLGGSLVNVFNTGNSLGYLNGFAFSNSGDVAGNYTGAGVSNSGAADNFSGFNTNNSGVITANANHLQVNDTSNSPTADVSGVQVNFTGTYDEIYGINSNVSSATSSTGKRKVSGTFIGENFNTFSQFTTVSSLPTVVDSGNGITSYFLVASGSPITDTSVIMNNLSGLVDIQDNFSGDPFYNLGLAMVGYVGQVSAKLGATASELSMAIAGGSVPATSDGGEVSKVNMFLAAGLLPGGGTILAPEINGFRARSDMCQLGTGNCFGVTVEDTVADNYLAKSLKIGGTKGTLDSSTALHLADKKALLFTPMTTAEKNALTASESMVVYDDTLGRFNYYNGSAWTDFGTGDVVGPSSSIDGQVALFDSTSGKLIKAATASGVAKLSSGVLSASSVDLTSEVTGVLPMVNGGTNKNMTASAGAVVYSDADSQELTAVGTANYVLQSNGASAPSWVNSFSTDWQMNSQSDMRFGDSDNSNYVAIQAPATIGTNFTWTLPSAVCSSGQVPYFTDGSGTMGCGSFGSSSANNSWTPTFSTGSGTVTNIAAYYSRNGNVMTTWGTFCVGTTSANPIYFSLPSGLSIDYTVAGGSIVSDYTPFGYFQRYSSGVVVGGDGGNQGLMFLDTTQGTGVFAVAKTLTGTSLTKANWTNLFSSNDCGGWWAQLPIYEWR